MNQSQVKYLRERVNQIVAEKAAKLDRATKDYPSLTWAEQLAQIKSGKAKLKSKIDRYTDIGKAFEFIDPNDAARSAQKAKHEAALRSLRARAQELVDRIMLAGAEADVLAEIQLFEKD